LCPPNDTHFYNLSIGLRRAYLRGLLVSQRFGVRGRRFHPGDVMDWIRRGAPTRIS
jgi:hypothetical protein